MLALKYYLRGLPFCLCYAFLLKKEKESIGCDGLDKAGISAYNR
jgi:hypothetical protein